MNGGGKIHRLLLSVALAGLAWAGLLYWQSARPAAAQGGISVVKALGRAEPVVYVGEYITFTIEICNGAGFTVTVMPLRDDYDEDVLAFQDASVAGYTHNPVTGTVDWTDVTETLGDFPDGHCETVIVGFIAEHPKTAIVNSAAVHDAEGAAGEHAGGGEDDGEAESIGGAAPVRKDPLTEGIAVGDPVSFTIVITNTGHATITRGTLVDTYDPAMLQFHYAVPMPDLVDEAGGHLTWTNIAASLGGGIAGRTTVSVTTVFTALQAAATQNAAQLSGVGDWYDNDLAGGADDAPITIVAGPHPEPTATPSPRPTDIPSPPSDSPSPPASTATPFPTTTSTPVPLLPLTGGPDASWVPGGLILLCLSAIFLVLTRE
jgi:uncharacterized repeat protein (TIGR01451 family)